MAITTGQATPNYSQSFSPAYGNPLIAALRANSPAPARQASGIEDISTGKIFNTLSGTGGTGGTGTTGTGGTGTTGTGGTGTGGTHWRHWNYGHWHSPKEPTPVTPVPENNWITDPFIPAPYVSPGPKSKTYQTNWDDLNATYASDYTKSQAAGITDARLGQQSKIQSVSNRSHQPGG
jgi:hypothetical protein